jgi:hypothetical protein
MDLVSLPFDQYARHAAVRDLVRATEPEGRLRILDVGGSGMVLRHFLPEHEVVVLDPSDPGDGAGPDYCQGSGLQIPFPDGVFHLAVSVDAFEHIPARDRGAFLSESLRVATQGIILAAPFAGRGVAQAEAEANELYRRLSGQDHPWLLEHVREGLPEVEALTAWLQQRGLEFSRSPNNYLPLWSSMIQINFMQHFFTEVAEESRQLNAYYNQRVAPHDMVESSYREVFFVRALGSQRPLPRRPTAPLAVLEAELVPLAGKIMRLVATLVEGLRQRDQRLRQELEHRAVLEKELRRSIRLQPLARLLKRGALRLQAGSRSLSGRVPHP